MNTRQKGTTTVEFALVAGLFFMLLFGIIEMGRAFFVWNTLVEVTRRGARVAAVSALNAPAIARVAVFNAPDGDSASPVLSNLSTANIQISYLTDTGTATTAFADVRYVQVAVTSYQHTFMIPFVYTTITVPDFKTILPRESLGVVPN